MRFLGTIGGKSAMRYISALLLCCYSLLLCEEVFHRHAPDVLPVGAAAVNDGAQHLAHGGNTDAPGECVICQSAVSQIGTETFNANAISVSFVLLFHANVCKPSLPRLRSVSLRGPPSVI